MHNTLYMIIAGSRDYSDYAEFVKVIEREREDFKQKYLYVVSGGARGADTMAEQFAMYNRHELKVFKADWNKNGKSAGYIRNAEMHNYIKQFEHRVCLCFWDGQSKGTQHNFQLAINNNTPLYVYNYNNHELIKRHSFDSKCEVLKI